MRTMFENGRRLGLAMAFIMLCGQSAWAQAKPPAKAPVTRGDVPPLRTAAAPPAGTTENVAPASPAAGANGAAGKPGQAAAPKQPEPPFRLTQGEQKLLDEILKHWEEHNNRTKTFKCKFTRWEYQPALAPNDPKFKANNYLHTEAKGEIKYKNPDMGAFRVREMLQYDPNLKEPDFQKVTENFEHWVCDGEAIYEYKFTDKKLLVHPIPKEMQGEAITDGPVPFIFGAKADKLKQRYFLRDATPKAEVGKHTWLEVFPRFQHDAANFQRAQVVLDDATFNIFALMIEMPGGQERTNFSFTEIVINDSLGWIKGDFASPTTPKGWQKEVDPVTDAPAAQLPVTVPADKREAKQGAAPPARR
jgi:TIGR03009 family protein